MAISQEEIIDILSTGGFVVPGMPEPLLMRLFFSSLAFVDASIAFQVNQLTGAQKRTIFAGNVVVPAGGADVIEVDLSALGLGGERIEVVLARPLLPETQIQPSADIITIGDDQATRPVVFLSNGDFARAREIRIPSVQGIAAFPNTVTWGVFDVPVSPSGAETLVNIRFSNVLDQAETALVRVNALVEGTTVKNPLLRQFVTVPANGAEVITLEGLDGLAIEVIIELPFPLRLAPILPLLTPSVDVTMTTDEETVETLLYLAPGEIRFL